MYVLSQSPSHPLSSLFFIIFLENTVTIEALSMDRTHKLANINNLTYNRLLQLTTFSDFSEFCFPKINVLYDPFIKALPILTFELNC